MTKSRHPRKPAAPEASSPASENRAHAFPIAESAEARPQRPAHLSLPAAAEWDRVVAELAAAGSLAKVDRAALAAYCQLWAGWMEAEEKLAELGPVVKSPSGFPIQNPYLAISHKKQELMLKFLVEFGMTPRRRPPTPSQPGAAAANAATADALEAIAAHLLPLGLAPADYPLAEHARIAAELIREIRSK